jgi:hypothetical protein
MKYYEWWPDDGEDDPDLIPQWSLELELEVVGYHEWDFTEGNAISNWSAATTAYYEGKVKLTDYPFTIPQIPVCSDRLKQLMVQLGVNGIQYLPLQVRHRESNNEVEGYSIANYLHIVDCLDRQRSRYQVWTKENLLYWEKRPYMLGTFRDVTKMVLDSAKIGSRPLFRLWGWTLTVIVREDIKRAIEEAGITGCLFAEREVV